MGGSSLIGFFLSFVVLVAIFFAIFYAVLQKNNAKKYSGQPQLPRRMENVTCPCCGTRKDFIYLQPGTNLSCCTECKHHYALGPLTPAEQQIVANDELSCRYAEHFFSDPGLMNAVNAAITTAGRQYCQIQFDKPGTVEALVLNPKIQYERQTLYLYPTTPKLNEAGIQKLAMLCADGARRNNPCNRYEVGNYFFSFNNK